MAALPAARFVIPVTLFDFDQTKPPSAPRWHERRWVTLLVFDPGLLPARMASCQPLDPESPERAALYTRNYARGLAAVQHQAEGPLRPEAERPG
jgi:hypothetical protein